jgi:hypothetical protein
VEYQLKTPINGANKVNVSTDSPLGKGATATVYRSSINGTSYAAKIFHDKSKLDLKKIEAMLANPPSNLTGVTAGIEYPRYSWPISIVEDSFGQAVGYVMPLIDQKESFTLDHYYDKNLGKKLNSPDEVALSYKIEIAANLSKLIADLHSHRHCFVDCKPQNIRVFKRTHAVTLLDCDGFSINDNNGKRFPAELLSTDYISPEAFREQKGAKDLGEYHDRYALATIIFQLLNGGIHPFQGIPTGQVTAATNDEKAAQGLYPHGLVSDPRIKPRPQSVHNCFDDATRELFDKAFMGLPKYRPSAAEWAAHLDGLLQNKQLTRCDQHPYDIRHMRFMGKPCPECQLQNISSPVSQTSKSSINLPPINSGTYSSPIPTKSKSGSLKWDWILGIGFVVFCIFAFTQNSSTPKQATNSQAAKTPYQKKGQEVKDRMAAGTVSQAAMTGITAANNISELNSYLYSGYKSINGAAKQMEANNSWWYVKETKKFYIRLINPTNKTIDKVLLGIYTSCEKHDNRRLLLLNLTGTPLKPYAETVYSGDIPFGGAIKLSFSCADIEDAYSYSSANNETSTASYPPSQPNPAPNGYAAIYTDPSSAAFSWAAGYPTQAQAEASAKASCAKRGAISTCTKMISGPYRCLALYQSTALRYGMLANTKEEAETKAKEACDKASSTFCYLPEEGSACAK